MSHSVPKCALIAAAGRGARLDRASTPKPLVDIAGEPMVIRLLRQLARAGIHRAAVVVGYAGDEVARAILAHRRLDIAVQIIRNPHWKDGLASSIACGAGAVNSPFLVAMADHVFDEPLVRQMSQHAPPDGGVAALVDTRLAKIDLSDAVGVRIEGDRIAEIDRCLARPDAVDAGLFVATPALFDAVSRAISAGRSELSDAIAILAAQGRVRAVPARDGEWSDVDRPADVVRTEMRIRFGRRHSTASSPPAASINPGEMFDFAAGFPTRTRVVVGHGFVRNPDCLDLVPAQSNSSPIFVFTDQTVHPLYGETFVAKLRAADKDVHSLVIPDGEEAKTLSNYACLVERVLSRGVDERSVLISLGGGVVCNVCGFVASTIYRGLDLVHLPTTLMAQCDAAVSHKQAINGHQGKNMVGSYYPPRLVAADIDVLQTLSRRQIQDGLAEVAKHALTQDLGYVRMLLDYHGDVVDHRFLEQVVRRNVELKRRILQADPTEQHDGLILQYGHTFGHPIEHLSGYRLLHGEAVAIGMMVAARVAHRLGACSADLVEVHERLLRHLGLPTRAPSTIRTEDVLDALRYNKRYLTEGTRMALLCEVGRLWTVEGQVLIPVSECVLADAFEATREEDETWRHARPLSLVRPLE